MLKYIAVFVLVAFPAWSDETSPEVRALSLRIVQELNSNLSCNAALISLQEKLKDTEGKLKAAEQKK